MSLRVSRLFHKETVYHLPNSQLVELTETENPYLIDGTSVATGQQPKSTCKDLQ